MLPATFQVLTPCDSLLVKPEIKIVRFVFFNSSAKLTHEISVHYFHQILMIAGLYFLHCTM